METMLSIKPIIDDRICQYYIAQTFTLWHEGIARSIYADYWLKTTGPLTAAEAAAIEVLREKLQKGDGCELLRKAMRGFEVEESVVKAFAVLSERAEQIYCHAQQGLMQWKERFQDIPPQWFVCINRELDHFFGITDDYKLYVYLLPSCPGGRGGTGGMFVGSDATTLECSGWPLDKEEALFLTLLHEAAHTIHQRQIIDPIVSKLVKAPEAQQIKENYERSPIANLQNFPICLSSYIGELVIHSLVPDGALREVCGLNLSDEYWRSICEKGQHVLECPNDDWGIEDIYVAWVMMGASAMVSVAREYIVGQRRLDEAFIYSALTIFQSLYDRWRKFS